MRGGAGDIADSKADRLEDKKPLFAEQSRKSQAPGAKDLDQLKQTTRVRVNPKHNPNVPYSLNRLKGADGGT